MTVLERDHVGAFCRHTHVDIDGAREGPLQGLHFGVKDIFDIAGHRTGFGNPDWLETHPPASHTASVVTRLLAGGATLVGKTHTEEMAFSLTGENAHYGTPTNSAAPTRVPGGSSSGSAAAVAAGLVDFAIGSDTGGSVRGPASFCGIYGIRPTHGRIALDGVLPLAPVFDTCGWLAQSASTLRRVGSVLLGEQTAGRTGGNAHAITSEFAAAPGQLLFAQDAFEFALPGVADALQPAVQFVSELLGVPRSITVSKDGLREWYKVFRVLQYDDIWRAHGEWIMRVKPKLGSQMQTRFAAVAASVAANDDVQVQRMQRARADIIGQLDTLLADNAVLLLPTISDVAPLLNASATDTVVFRERALAMLCIAGLGGLPQISLPFATHNGAPLGLSLIAARGNDEMLLSVAETLASRASTSSLASGVGC